MDNPYTLITGLGNIGSKYAKTRHNAGFLLLDYLADTWNLSEYQSVERTSKVSSLKKYPSPKLALLKPLTMMNLSGQAVSEVLGNLTVAPQKLVVAYDDLDIKLGSYKIKQGSSPKQHNGVNSVVASVGYSDFTHVRIGIENRTDTRINGVDYVLGKFSAEELVQLNEVFSDIATELSDLVTF